MANPTSTSKKVYHGDSSTDFMHFLDALGNVIAWIDPTGTGQGFLASFGSSLNFSSEEIVSITAGSSTGTLAHTPNNGLFMISRNGILQKSTADYSRVGTTVTLVTPAENGDNFLAWYTY